MEQRKQSNQNTNNINITKDLSQIFVRIDGKIAGPFEKVPEKNIYFDTKNHELYTSDGTILDSSGNLKEEKNSMGQLISKFVEKRKSNYEQCDCPSCQTNRELLKQGIKTDAISKIETIYSMLDEKPSDIDLPENTNDWIDIPTLEQMNWLTRLLSLLTKQIGFEEIKKLLPDMFSNVNIVEIEDNVDLKTKFKKPKSNPVNSEQIENFFKLQLSLFQEKNILIDCSIKKLSQLKSKQFDKLYRVLIKQFKDVQWTSEGINFQIKL